MIFFSLAGLLSTFFLSLMWMDTHTWGQAQHGPDPPDHFCIEHGDVGVRGRLEIVTCHERSFVTSMESVVRLTNWILKFAPFHVDLSKQPSSLLPIKAEFPFSH